jgi:hypothetical protein
MCVIIYYLGCVSTCVAQQVEFSRRTRWDSANDRRYCSSSLSIVRLLLIAGIAVIRSFKASIGDITNICCTAYPFHYIESVTLSGMF